MEYVGIQDGGDGFPELELRNCPCGTTLAIELDAPDASVTLKLGEHPDAIELGEPFDLRELA